MKKGILFRCRKTAAVVMAFAMTLSYLPQQGISAYAKDGSVASQSQVTVSSRECSGWYESAYVEWQPVDGAKSYNVYIKGETEADSAYKKLDDELIRQYPDYWRADAPGLKAGKYMFKVEAVTDSTTASIVTSAVEVMSYDRSGYGFVNGTSSGAYNEDGTLKDNAVVLYITENTKDTVSLDVVTGSKGEVTSYTGLQEILYGFKKGKDSRPLDVRLVGNITDLKSMDKGDIVIDGCKNGITFEGIGEDATANGWGLRVKGSSNVEIRNLAYMNCDSDEGDDVGLQQDNDHVWVHNCDFFYGHAGSDADQKKGDGALDTKTSTYVTHSYNHFYDTGKSNLQGMKSETTSNYITYHHNWYDHADSRCPRIRTCTVHVYNNYYDGNSKYGIGATMGSSVFSENNYYRNCKFPMLMAGQGSDTKYAETVKGIFSGENGGVIKAYGNHIEGAKAAVTYQKDAAGFDFYEASSRDEVIDCSALKGGSKYSNFDTAADFYKYSVQSAEDAKDTVIKYAGRMNGGDFKWTFDNSVDDESYAVNEPLKAKLMSYKTTLVSVGGSVSDTDRPGTGETPGTGEDKPGTGEDKPGTGEDKPGTGEDKPSTGETAASAVHNFTTDYTTADNFFTISGNLANNKGTNTYNGLNLTKCLKMESSTSITFKAASKGKLVLVTAASKKIKIDGKDIQADADGVISMDVEAGEHKIAKKDATILFYISFTGDGSQTPGTGEDKPSTGEDKPSTGGNTEGNVESKGDAPKIDNAEDIAKKIEASVELTDEEKASIAAGSNISVSLVINDVVKTEEKELVEKNLSSLVENGNIGQIFDISIIKKIGDGEAVSAQVNKEVTLQIAVPEKLLNKDSNIERTYKIIRVHNGEVTVLDSDKCQFNEKTGVITFKTDKFSTYAIIYTDKAKEVISGGSEAGGKDNTDNGNNANIDVKEEPVLGSTADDSVNTGDNFNLYMYLMLLAVSGAALFLSKKKKYKNN